MLKFKRANKLIKEVIATDSDSFKKIKQLFRTAPESKTGRKHFSNMRLVEHNGKQLYLIINPRTKDRIINVVQDNLLIKKISDKQELLQI